MRPEKINKAPSKNQHTRVRVRNGWEAGATAITELGTDIESKGKLRAKRADKVMGCGPGLSS
ncbi:hypothetical protein GCM10022409_22920 [Hymenobacter glaciei]|uniref:Uncharacterized protein n=1 Tax=Hymenobacter glaciei TaxID=877209 RepID=A0ABP7U9Q0_9BACT